MKIEHIAFNVAEPVSVAGWYVEHLGFAVKRKTTEPPYTHFLADEGGNSMIEIYGNSEAPVPDYGNTNPFVLHLAVVSEDLDADLKRLTNAGATSLGGIQHTGNGDRLAMLRDPWGFAIQLVSRSDPML